MTDLAQHAHVAVRVSPDEVMLVRRVRHGRVYYLAPGVPVGSGETPGAAAVRAARDGLGLEVEIGDVLHAQAFSGIDHFFFSATPIRALAQGPGVLRLDDFELEGKHDGTYEIVSMPVRALLAYDVRPPAVARAVARESW